MNKINVLIFPAGAENAINIYDSLKYNLHFNIYGASGKADHAEFIYPKENLFLEDLYINKENFIEEFNKVLEKFKIDYIIPSHDTVALYLTKHEKHINAHVVCSIYETTKIAENKMLTYEVLKDCKFYPKVYDDANEVKKFPVFLKPFVGAGGKGTYLIRNRDELEKVLIEHKDLLISDYLPGKEYTIDCFTNKDGELLFAGPRERERISMGISFRTKTIEYNEEFKYIADELNSKFKLRGAWFFQVKEDKSGNLKFMEFSVRQAGTMTLYRQLGVNFAALSLFDAMNYDVKVLYNDYKLRLDRSLKNSYHLDYNYDKAYIDFDDTLIVNGKINTNLMKLIYQWINSNKQIILLTKHEYDLNESLKRYHICRDIFNEIIIITPDKKKADYIDNARAIFIDNYFPERVSVREICKIPVFDVDAIECLFDSSAF